MKLVRARGVCKRFGDLTAVDDVDLTVESGEVVGLLGANGAGKTTLMRMLLGLERATTGTIELLGSPITPAARRRIGYVPQGLGLYEDLTLEENLGFVAAAFKVDPPSLGDLQRSRNVLVRDLSLGLRRRTAFAGALSHSPELLVLDEPTSGVDVLARSDLWTTIRESAERGAGVLVSTHHLEEADQCDRLVVMSGGRVVLFGTMSEIIDDVTGGTERIEAFERRFAELARA
jgi:ABC-2 type transport system ATP-binding protein